MMAKKETKKAEGKEYVSNPDPHALETVEVVKVGNLEVGSKIELHPNTANILKQKGAVK